MEFQTYVSWISSPVQIAFLDLVLGADNAVIIALVCRTLPRHQRTNVMIVGTGAAMLLRIVLTAVTGALMFVPVLRLAGGLVLMLIAISLTDELDVGPIPEMTTGKDGAPRDSQAESEAFWDAILLVVLADGVMSLDNTVALAAVANGNVIYLVLGLALSVPTLVFGSWLLSELLGATPFLATIAMAVLGWIAGDMAVSDPLIADWVRTTAPALTLGIPLACVIFVLGKAAFKPVVVPLPVAGPFDGFGLAAAPAEADSDGQTDARDNTAQIPPRQGEGGQMPSHLDGWDAPDAPLVSGVMSEAPPPDQSPERLATLPILGRDGGEQDPVQPIDAPAVAENLEPRFADLENPQIPPQQKPARGERLVVIGLIVLFSVAAVIMSAAIYFGGATF